MATELLEYRPGKWVKVVDGRIVGRATPEEVAAWHQAGGHSQARPELDLDVDLSPAPAADPARMLDVSLRPAFARRGRPVEPAAPPAAGPCLPENRPARGGQGPAALRRQGTAVPRPAGGAQSEAMTARPTAPLESRKRPADPAAPRKPESPVAGATRPAPAGAAQPAPAGATQPAPAGQTEPTPIDRPRQARPAIEQRTEVAPAPEPTAGAAPEPEPPVEALPAEEAEQRADRSPSQGAGFWWIWNAHQQPVAAFLAEWAPKYELKFGRRATVVLCHATDLEAVEACGYAAQVSPLLQPGHFYLGQAE